MAVLDKRGEHADEYAKAPRSARSEDQRHRRQDGDDDLKDAADDHGLPDSLQLGQREVETDRKQQQHDADLGQRLDVVLGLDDAQARGSRHGSGDDQRDDRRDAKARQPDDEDEGDRIGEDQFSQQRIGHGSVSAARHSSSAIGTVISSPAWHLRIT